MAVGDGAESLGRQAAAVAVARVYGAVGDGGAADAVGCACQSAGTLEAVGYADAAVAHVAVVDLAFAARGKGGSVDGGGADGDVIQRKVAQRTQGVHLAEHGGIACAAVDVEALDGVARAVEMTGEVVVAVADGSEVVARHVQVGGEAEILPCEGARAGDGVGAADDLEVEVVVGVDTLLHLAQVVDALDQIGGCLCAGTLERTEGGGEIGSRVEVQAGILDEAHPVAAAVEEAHVAELHQSGVGAGREAERLRPGFRLLLVVEHQIAAGIVRSGAFHQGRLSAAGVGLVAVEQQVDRLAVAQEVLDL